jgi:betaine reductase
MAHIQIMHYLNQFFAGKGGEDKADTPLSFSAGPEGPGKRLQALLGNYAKISLTAYCGDNYFVEHQSEVLEQILRYVKDKGVEIVAAGPAFAAGRYGFACGEICHFLTSALDCSAVMGMHSENPGVDGYRQYKDDKVFIVPTSESLSGPNMENALSSMAQFIDKLANQVQIGPALLEGYITRGIRRDELADKTGVDRAIDMLLHKINGNSFTTEIPIQSLDRIAYAPPISNIKKAHIALVTTCGLVPRGNPDKFKLYRNTQWRKYSIDKVRSMKEGQWEVIHGGHNPTFINANPNCGVPVDACRDLEENGAFSILYPYFYMTTGVQALLSAMEHMGTEIAGDMKSERIDGALLVAT